MPIFDSTFLNSDDWPAKTTGSGSIVHAGQNEQDQFLALNISQAGDTYIFQVNADNSNGNPLPDPEMVILAPNGSQLTVDDGGTTNNGLDSQIVYTMAETGFFDVLAQSHTPVGTGDYTVNVLAVELHSPDNQTVKHYDALNTDPIKMYAQEYNTGVGADHGLDTLLRQTIVMDDNQVYVDQFDNNNTGGWLQAQEHHDANGNITDQFLQLDDGTFQVIDYDEENSGAWGAWVFDYNAAGQNTASTIFRDDGSVWAQNHFDVTGQDWNTMADNYTPDGQHESATVFYDDGHIWQTQYDTTGQAWSQTTTIYEANGHVTSQQQQMDDGSWHLLV